MNAIVFGSALALAEASCPGFQTQNSAFCGGLTKQPDITDAQSCADLCCSDADCDTWQFCPERPEEPGSGCSGWAGSRCWTGKAGSCSSKTHWVGESKNAAPQPTPTPTPSPTPSPSPSPSPSPAPLVTRKKGFSGFLGDYYTCDDAKALGLENSWYYSWISNPWGQYSRCKDKEMAAEFVPMLNGLGTYKDISATKMRWFQESNVRFLLGYNEPDYGNGHNHPHMCSPADAAKDWVHVQEVAAMFDPPLILVGPGISSKGPDALDADGGSIWLDEFLGNCSDVVPECDPSLIKYIGMHDYQGDAQKLMRRLEGGYKKYNRKIWLTEFALMNWDGPTPTRAQHDDYLTEVLPLLEASEAVFRYAWFTARNKPNAGEGESWLLPYDSSSMELSSTGKVYKNGPGSVVSV